MTEIKYNSQEEENLNRALAGKVRNFSGPELQENLGLFITSKNLARLLFLNYLYQKIVDVHGVVMDFGTRHGQNAVVFSNLRSIYEPFNRHRKVVAFDTFTGFPSVEEVDGGSSLMEKGNLALPAGYEKTLDAILSIHEGLNPLSHINKFEVVKGDVCDTLPSYLERNPETIVALAYFDMDIYRPTKEAFSHIKCIMPAGAIIAFDELCDHDSPGETLAFFEHGKFKLPSLRRWKHCSRTSYFVVGE